ncbi:conserved Plasmodium protein, unknown function [Plasmodium ovale]|uniref:Uncharacterized protein n=2 Tax=Plasmodium ovale TaxID=36330 RepID=A0A1A8WXU4_PLAOA|nr:conserved Plasmodium protein, unknown function [Plasmodium ovale curtisi]SBS97786.1 conserved Plasmodium protein, unknown function [Plasmodium ovale curtisi]SCP06335.1 conserved Plasmodium protein, unknown function [Plasmodium ovale]
MKRYIINSNRFYNPKKVKVECQYEGEIKKKDHTFSGFFDLNAPFGKGIENTEKKNIERLNFFNIEANGKRRRINFINILSEVNHLRNCRSRTEDSNRRIDDYNAVDNNNNRTKKPLRRKNEWSKKRENCYAVNSNNTPNDKHKEKSIENLKEGTIQHVYEEDENKKIGSYRNVKNKYYEKINHLLKEIHLSKIARKNAGGGKCAVTNV